MAKILYNVKTYAVRRNFFLFHKQRYFLQGLPYKPAQREDDQHMKGNNSCCQANEWMQNGRKVFVFQWEVCPHFQHFPGVLYCFLPEGKKKEHCVSDSEATFPHWGMSFHFSLSNYQFFIEWLWKTKPIQRIPEGLENPLSVSLMDSTAKKQHTQTYIQINTLHTESRDCQSGFQGREKEQRSHFLLLFWYHDATYCHILLLNCSLTARCPPQSCHQKRIANTKVAVVCLSSCCAACF